MVDPGRGFTRLQSCCVHRACIHRICTSARCTSARCTSALHLGPLLRLCLALPLGCKF